MINQQYYWQKIYCIAEVLISNNIAKKSLISNIIDKKYIPELKTCKINSPENFRKMKNRFFEKTNSEYFLKQGFFLTKFSYFDY